MIIREVSGWHYRMHDSIIIVETKEENGQIKYLYLFCPSAAIMVDPVTEYHFYAYDLNLRERMYRAIEYLTYDPNKKYGLNCDGTIDFIKFTDEPKSNMGIRPDIIRIRYNNKDSVKVATSASAWAGFGTAMADIVKPLYDGKGNGENNNG